MQEIVDAVGGTGKYDQARQIAEAFPELNVAFGETRPLHGGRYGNMLMTRFPILETRTHDITKSTREERGVLQCAIEMEGGAVVNVFNVHLGTGYMERRRQIEVLIGEEILAQPDLTRTANCHRGFQRMDARTDDEAATAEFPERSSDTESAVRTNLPRRTANPEPGSLLLRTAVGDDGHNDLAKPQGDDRLGSFAADRRFPVACALMNAGSGGVAERAWARWDRTTQIAECGIIWVGAGRGGRTPTTLRSADFESAASASSAIPAWGGVT